MTTIGITHVRTLKSGKIGHSRIVEPISLSEVITVSSFGARIKNMWKNGILYLYEAIGINPHYRSEGRRQGSGAVFLGEVQSLNTIEWPIAKKRATMYEKIARFKRKW